MASRFVASTAIAVIALASTLLLAAPATPDSDPNPPGLQNPAPGQPGPDDVAALAVSGGGHNAAYVTIAPCRIVDTAKSAAGNLGSDAARNFVVTGTTGFPTQGGTTGGCGIPAYASAITASLTATSVTQTGNLRAWARGTTMPDTTALLLPKGGRVLDSQTVPISASGMTVKPVGARSRLVIDVTGYYAPEIFASVNTDGSLYQASRLAVSLHPAVGNFQLTTDRTITSCIALVTSFGPYRAGGYTNGTTVFVQVTDWNGNPVDAYFQVHVVC